MSPSVGDMDDVIEFILSTWPGAQLISSMQESAVSTSLQNMHLRYDLDLVEVTLVIAGADSIPPKREIN